MSTQIPDDFFSTAAVDRTAIEVHAFSVSAFLSGIGKIIEDQYPYVAVRGEVSSISIPRSGHAYFVLKDSEAQLKAVMFQGSRIRNRYFPEEGEEVVVLGRPGVYRPRGDLQIVVEKIIPYGEGLLEQQFNALKERLRKEGLFSPEKKKDVPEFPARVFLVTSPTGAAVRDFLKTAGARLVAGEIVLCPVRVQGQGADMEIIEMVDLIEGVATPEDVLVFTRGGGSREDLWTFNSEGLARRIFKCAIPTVSAIGHEIDFTILDFVADRRAQTPTAAAQLLFPERDGYRARLTHLGRRLERALSFKIIERRHFLKDLSHRLKDPTKRLHEKKIRLDELIFGLERTIHRTLEREKGRLINLDHALSATMSGRVGDLKGRLARLSAGLDALSPLKVLARGYSIVTTGDGELIRRAQRVNPGDILIIRPMSGRITCKVKEVTP